MKNSDKPILSIGIIFKNEIRCLERCIRSLEPLRKAVPCELVMADTGSDDGSREVAEKYADILFDFEWINDFSAARNAVMDKCSGEWFFSIDADEWIDDDIEELVIFLQNRELWTCPACGVKHRNLFSTEVKDDYYTDFLAVRMARLTLDIRYEGTVHETLVLKGADVLVALPLSNTLLYHDGYIESFSGNNGKTKRNRNMELLKEKLKKYPDSLLVMMQCIESSSNSGELEYYARMALDAIERKADKWELVGPPILRHAVISADRNGMQELEERAHSALRAFPNSLYTKIDVAFTIVVHYYNKQKYSELIQWGETYIDGINLYESGSFDMIELIVATLLCATPRHKAMARFFLGAAYALCGRYAKAKKVMHSLDYRSLLTDQFGNYIKALLPMHSFTHYDTSSIIADMAEYMSDPTPSRGIAEGRKKLFVDILSVVFTISHRQEEQEKPTFHRPAYTLLLPLVHKHDLGNAAAILQTEDAAEIDALLGEIKDWRRFPPDVVLHALRHGAAFPPADKPLCIDDMTALAGGIAGIKGAVQELSDGFETSAIDGEQELSWLHSLITAAVRANKWAMEENTNIWAPRKEQDEVDEEYSMRVARIFAEVEGKFLRLCYSDAALSDPMLTYLPDMHRFGWHMANAFALLDEGDAVGFVKTLRKALAANNEAKDMITFLTEHTEQLKPAAAPVSPELAALAEQVRTILAAYPADDPAVQAVKASPIYKQVAHIIEGGA